MKYIKHLFLCFFLRLRYKFHIINFKKTLKKIDKNKGILFVCNLNSEIDPLLLKCVLNPSTTFLICKRIFNLDWIQRLCLFFIKSIIINKYLINSSHYLKITENKQKKLLEKIYEKIICKKKKIAIFLKDRIPSFYNQFTDASIVNFFANKHIKPNIVLVTIKGIYGSSFSKTSNNASHIKTKSFFSTFSLIIKNFIFFIPKRDIYFYFSFPPNDFPYNGSNNSINLYLDNYFCSEIKGIKLKENQEKEVIIPYYFWGNNKSDGKNNHIEKIIIKKIAKLANIKKNNISPQQNLYTDLNLNSLDVTELLIFLEINFKKHAYFNNLNKVEDLINIVKGEEYKSTENSVKEKHSTQKKWLDITYRKKSSFPKGKTLCENFLLACEMHQNSFVSTEPRIIITYNRLKSMVIGLALVLKNLKCDEKIGIMLPTSSFFNTLLFSLSLTKKIPVLINWTLGTSHIKDVIKENNITMIITDENLLKKINIKDESITNKFIFQDSLKYELSYKIRKKALALSRKPTSKILSYFNYKKPNEIALILFTTGSEKTPKAIPLTHKNILSNEKACFDVLDFQKEDVFLGILPSFHIFGLSITNILPLICGIRSILIPNILDLNLIIQMINYWKPTIIVTTPTFLINILKLIDKKNLEQIKYFILGAEKCPDYLFKKIDSLNLKGKVIEGYGSTECSPVITLNDPNNKRNGVGQPLPNVNIKIVDPITYKEKNHNEKGLILVKGNNVFNGYLNNVNDTTFITIDNEKWYNTKDIGFLTKNNSLHLFGRLNRTVKKAGEFINLEQLEEVIYDNIKNNKDTLQLALIYNKNRLYLFSNITLELDEINKIITNEGFSNFFKINHIIKLVQLPLFANGKINYQNLLKKIND